MTYRLDSRVLVVAVAGAILAIAQAAHATTPLPSHPPAGPWYTAPELHQLKAYSVMSFLEKQKYLAGDAQAAVSAHRQQLAGPWYTPKERLALTRYANSSISERKAILAGTGISTGPRLSAFHWRDATIGAAVASLVTLLAVSAAYAISRTRSHRRGLRPT